MSEPEMSFGNLDDAMRHHHAELVQLADAMAKPERPTCDTCPHYQMTPKTSQGVCLRYPPVLAQLIETKNPVGYWVEPAESLDAWSQPRVIDYDSCGEHPDFPAYITARKASDQLTNS